jgi:uncharacterized protein (TIGR03437 family)
MKSLILVLLCALGCEAQMLWFEPNCGQVHPAVQALAHTRAGYVYIGRDELAVQDVRIRLAGASKTSEAVLEEPTGGISSYFQGRDEKDWRTGIPQYSRVRLKNVYAGIDLVYYGNTESLEYDFVLRPGADPAKIRLAFNKPAKLDGDGDLLVGGLRQRRARVFQGGKEIASEYAIGKSGEVRLALAEYDRSQTLTVDPTLVFSTYIGGPGADTFNDLKVDSNGYVYLGGSSQTPASPTLDPFQQTNTVGLEPFVLKFSGDGQHVIFYAVIGDPYGWDEMGGIAIDKDGSLAVVGYTNSSHFPLKNAFQTQYTAGLFEAYVTRLSSDGRSLIFSTYLGGTLDQEMYPGGSTAIDSAGNIWVTGDTSSQDFPVKNAIQQKLGGGYDVFLTKFSPTGALLYSTYFGGAGNDFEGEVALDADDNVYVTGWGSATFPLKNALQTAHNVGVLNTAYLFSLSPDGQSVRFSTFLGDAAPGGGNGLAFDGAGNIYVAGGVYSSSLITTPDAVQPNFGGGAGNAFLIKLNRTASEVLYSTYFGATDEEATDVKVDSDGFIYLTGYTDSPNFPVKNPLQPFRGGGPFNRDLFVVKISPSGALVYSTPWGGSNNEYTGKVAVAGNGGVYVCGSTVSTDFPVQNAFQPKYGGGSSDGVFALIADSTPAAPSPLTPSPGVLSFNYTQGAAVPTAQTVTITGGPFVASASTSWLISTPQAGSVDVTVSPANLAPGTYNGTLTLTPPLGTPASVAVTLAVFAPAPVLTSLSPSFITVGSSDTTITLSGSGFTASTSILLNGIGWTETPVQFVNSSTLTVDMPPGELAGVFTWSITVQNPQSQPSNVLSLNVGIAVENAASYVGGPVAPGEIVTIFGSGLSGTVTFDDVPGIVSYQSSTQINVTVPYTVTGPVIDLQIGSAVITTLDVVASAPGIFAAVADGGGAITLYATGCGALTKDSLPRCQLPVSATINGKPAQVLYAGIAPGLVQGANQFNLMLPSGITSGPISIVVTVGNASSKAFSFTLP